MPDQGTTPVVVIVQARMTSTRLPGKILKPLAGAPMILRMIERLRHIPGLDTIAVALAEGAVHDPIADALAGSGVAIVRGSETDVLARTAAAARATKAATVMRITSDCPLIDPHISGAVLGAYLAARNAGFSYARTAFDQGYPLGFDTEVFSSDLLFEAERESVDNYEREHVTPFIWRRPERYPSLMITSQPDHRDWRLVVDTETDYQLMSAIYDALYPNNPAFGYPEIAALFESQPELLALNQDIVQTPYEGLP